MIIKGNFRITDLRVEGFTKRSYSNGIAIACTAYGIGKT